MPTPRSRPSYEHPPAKLRSDELRRWSLAETVDALFFGYSCLATLWLAWLLFRQSMNVSWLGVGYLVLFWAVLSYLALPRLNRILAGIYVPDYFIGRTRTSDGLLGDPVNLAVMGRAEQIHDAFGRAGWTRADDVTLRSSWSIVVSSVLRRSYPAAPVSPLYLFGRRQEFAYQQEVEGNPAQRHHVRFWPCPPGWRLPGGERVDWLAAGTYDRRVGLSLFTLQITHKIDANIDIERDYIVDTLAYALPELPVRVIRDFSTGYHSRNGGGDRIRTDGHLPVVDVGGSRPGALPADAAVSAAAPRRPTSLLFGSVAAGLAVLAHLASLALAVVGDHASTTPGAGAGWDVLAEASYLAAMAAVVVLTVRTLTGRPHSRTALMAVLSASIAAHAFDLAGQVFPGAQSADVVHASLTILALVALSSSSTRQWADARRRPRAVPLP